MVDHKNKEDQMNPTIKPTTDHPLHITVDDIKALNGTGNLKAFVTVTINDKLTIHSCRIVHQPGQAAWVSLPQREWRDGAGDRHFAPLIELLQEVREAIQEEVLKVWENSQ